MESLLLLLSMVFAHRFLIRVQLTLSWILLVESVHMHIIPVSIIIFNYLHEPILVHALLLTCFPPTKMQRWKSITKMSVVSHTHSNFCSRWIILGIWLSTTHTAIGGNWRFWLNFFNRMSQMKLKIRMSPGTCTNMTEKQQQQLRWWWRNTTKRSATSIPAMYDV